MTQFLPIGSVVQLKNGQTKVMIVNRFPLYNNQGKVGYLDYSACLFPTGLESDQVYFFNKEDIETIWFEGYVDELEKEMQEKILKEQSHITYPKYTLNDLSK